MALVPVPEVIPLFPLAQTVLLPGEVLPLHVFEPRYVEMVRDALSGSRIIGMVQVLPGHEQELPFAPPVREVGCAGVIARHRELEDGRFLIWLLGVERFRIRRELDTVTRYRLVHIGHEAGAVGQGLEGRRQTLLASLTLFLDARLDGGEEEVDSLVRRLGQVDDEPLVAAAAQILGITGERKQALLEAKDLPLRYDLLQEEMDLASGETPRVGPGPRLVH